MLKKAWNWLKKSWLLIWGATYGSRTLIIGFLFFIIFFLGVSGSLDCLWGGCESDSAKITQEPKKVLDEEAAKAKLMASGLVDESGNIVNSFGEAIGGFFNFTLPNGQNIQIPENGFEEKFLSFLENGDGGNDSFIFDRIYFKTGSSVINKSSNDQIESTASILKAFNERVILLKGHTDNVGNEELNKVLSLKRANALKTILVEKGISADRILVKGYGSVDPIEDNRTSKGRRINRRIDISVIR